MTRINTIDPSLLTNEHLIAELRELPRIPNSIAEGKAKVDLKAIPETYRLGQGHVKFFYNKLAWLQARHTALRAEYFNRTGKEFSILIDWAWLDNTLLKVALFNDWTPSITDHSANITRLKERLELRKRAYHFEDKKIITNQDVEDYLKILSKVY